MKPASPFPPAACAAPAAEPSYVLQAIGFDRFRARGALRTTLGRFSTAGDVERFLAVLPPIVAGLRSITGLRRRAGQPIEDIS